MIDIKPYCPPEPDDIQKLVASKTLRLEVGGYYFNGKGEVRKIVKFDTIFDEFGGYNYYDNHDYTYMECGIYDLHDTFNGDTRLDLIMPISMSHFVNSAAMEEAKRKADIFLPEL